MRHVKRQLISADAERLAGDQQRVGAAVGIGRGFLKQRAGAAANLVKRNPHTWSRASLVGVEHVGRQPPGGDRHAWAVHQRNETEPGDQADLVQRRLALGLLVVGKPSLELAKDRIPGVAADADDEGKAEFLPVGGVEPVEAVELPGAEPVEP